MKILLLLAAVLSVLFFASFVPGWVVASNDAPFGTHVADRSRSPGSPVALWDDLNWLGSRGFGPQPGSVSQAVFTLSSTLVAFQSGRFDVRVPLFLVFVAAMLLLWQVFGWKRAVSLSGICYAAVALAVCVNGFAGNPLKLTDDLIGVVAGSAMGIGMLFLVTFSEEICRT